MSASVGIHNTFLSTADSYPGEYQSYVVGHIDEAVEKGWIKVYYQPVVRTVSGKLCGLEALARWEDPQYGLLPPSAFVGPLEKARLIHKLDACMIRQVCKCIGDNIAADKQVVPVSFNLSRLDFDLCDIQGVIEEAVRENEVPRRLLNIEITESVFGSDPAFIVSAINKFHNVGYQVWMDDFGSAYSSLNVLKDFDFDVLKIDMAFLSRFGEKSRIIIASVVDMAKRLGIQTLAEGVETHEHREFLRHIGCEKQQGYLYGRPAPYFDELMRDFSLSLGIERSSERRYYRTIGRVNTLSLSEGDFIAGSAAGDYVTSMPLAFVEYDGERFSFLDCNDPFIESLAGIDVPDIETAELLINDTRRLPARSLRRLIGNIEEEQYARHDYMTDGKSCVMRAKFVASHGNRITVLVTIDSAMRMNERARRARRREALDTIYSIYEHVDILDLDNDTIEAVYSQAAFKPLYNVGGLSQAITIFAKDNVFSADHRRYFEFMDLDTLAQRVDAHSQGFIVGFFRMRDHGGDYTWKIFVVIRLTGEPGNRLLVCIRDTNWENDALFQAAYEQGGGQVLPSLESVDMRISDGSLWRSLVQAPGFNVFWKDTARRYVGCNQSFLDYYGFDSADSILGKTDEDMGWHVNPVPFMNDENRVIHEGRPAYNVPGQCIVKGALHDIVASKRPVYRNGRIVGLVGFFFDVTDPGLPDVTVTSVRHTDTVTGALNFSGLEEATGRYVESYQRNGMDFAMMMVDIDRFKRFNELFGYDFGDMVLRKVADVIREIAGAKCVLGHIYADRFVLLLQNHDDDDLGGLGNRIVETLRSIPDIEGTSCTIFADYAFIRFSEVGDAKQLRRLAQMRLEEARGVRRPEQ